MPLLRAAHEVQDENDQQNNHKNPNDSIARSGDGKRHVSSFVVCRLSVSISSCSKRAAKSGRLALERHRLGTPVSDLRPRMLDDSGDLEDSHELGEVEDDSTALSIA